MKKLIVLLIVVASISACSDKEKADIAKRRAATIELNKFHSKKLKDLTCGNIDHQYERCGEYNFVTHVKSCRDQYLPVLMKCYGVK